MASKTKNRGAAPAGRSKTKAGRPAKVPAPVEVPADMRRALAVTPAARAAFEKMPPSHRREVMGYIDEAKRPETRARRIEKTLRWLEDPNRR